VFNEVFLYWFPNFGFAALLMGLVLVTNMIGPRTAAAAQTLFTATALLGLAALALAGLITAGPEARDQALRATNVFPGPKAYGLAAIALVGWDLVAYTRDGHRRSLSGSAIVGGLAAGALLLSAWNAAALLHVAPSRLADTTIPHILAAKAIGGQTGRLIMGTVVIAGACAAVNLLFRAVARMLADMAAQGLMPAIIGKNPARPWLPLSVLAGLSGTLMATGFAGSDWLDVTLRAGLIMWLAAMGLGHRAALAVPLEAAHTPTPATGLGAALRRRAVLIATLILAGILIATDEDPLSLVTAILILAGMAAVLALVGRLGARCSVTSTRDALPLTKGALP
jgi:hypothetical protein